MFKWELLILHFFKIFHLKLVLKTSMIKISSQSCRFISHKKYQTHFWKKVFGVEAFKTAVEEYSTAVYKVSAYRDYARRKQGHTTPPPLILFHQPPTPGLGK